MCIPKYIEFFFFSDISNFICKLHSIFRILPRPQTSFVSNILSALSASMALTQPFIPFEPSNFAKKMWKTRWQDSNGRRGYCNHPTALQKIAAYQSLSLQSSPRCIISTTREHFERFFSTFTKNQHIYSMESSVHCTVQYSTQCITIICTYFLIL